VRPFNNYGPRAHFEGDSGEVIPRFILRALAGEPPVIFGDGSHTRDFLYVKDCAEALVTIAECDALVGDIVNLGYGEEVRIDDLARLVLEAVGRTDLRPSTAERPGDVPRLWVDPAKLRRPRRSGRGRPLAEGLAATVDYYRGVYAAQPDCLAGCRRATGRSRDPARQAGDGRRGDRPRRRDDPQRLDHPGAAGRRVREGVRRARRRRARRRRLQLHDRPPHRALWRPASPGRRGDRHPAQLHRLGQRDPLLRGQPVFVDIDPATLNMDPKGVAAAVTPRTRAILAVHQVGRPADSRSSRGSPPSGAWLIEDAACADREAPTGEGRSATTPIPSSSASASIRARSSAPATAA
jgi:hypothetical protein